MHDCMSYPFENPEVKFGNLIKSLADLSNTDSPFDKDFSSRLPSGKAFGFDQVKDRVCAYRSPNAKQKLHSADAFLIGERNSEPWYYFIDFKNQKVDNIQSVKDPDRNELMQKAFDSLSILAMTFGQDVSMRQLQCHSSFIVVYPQQNYGSSRVLGKSDCLIPLET